MARLILALGWLLALAGSALAQSTGGGASIDQMYLAPISRAITTVNVDTKVNTLRANQTLNPAVRNLVLVAAGQSNMTSITPSAYTPTNASAIDMLSLLDGAVYAAKDPLLGGTTNIANNLYGHPALRLADSLISAGKFDRVVIVHIAIGGSVVADWATGYLSQQFTVAFRRLAARGMVAGTNVTVAVIWGQGENDTTFGTTQADYTARLNTVIAQTRAAGFTGRWFVAKESWNSVQTSSAIQAAQAAVVNNTDVFAGPDADSLLGNVCVGSAACRQPSPDLQHWSDAGAASYASGWQSAMAASGAPF